MISSIIGFIFARGGSKGVKKKNIRLVNGKPLIAYAIESAKASKYIDRIIVSTDDEEIASTATQYGAEVPFIRPKELAQDDTPELLAWKHAITTIEEIDGKFSLFVSIPATSPLRYPRDIDACIEEMIKTDADLVLTGKTSERNPYFNMLKLDENGYASLVIKKSSENVFRRQDAPQVFDITTVAYVARPDYILNTNELLAGKIRLVMIPKERSLDIDDEYDLKLAELILKERHESQMSE